MQVKFNRAALQEALTLTTGIIPVRTPKPILKCLRITAEGDSVRICATDLEVGVNYQITQVEVIKEGEVIVPGDKFASIVHESVDEVLEIESSESTVHIKGADSHFTIYGHEAGQYPAVAQLEGKADFELNLSKLQEGIELCVFAAARESTRYALNGILWEVNGKKLILVATDGRRLARSTITLDATVKVELPQGRVIVPAKTMSLLEKVAGDTKAKVAVQFVDNRIALACEQVVISSNLVEGNFPKYEEIIPKDYDKKLVLSTEATLSAVRRAALLANEDSKGIKLSLEKDTLVFSGRAPETGDAQVEMAVEYSGPEMQIGFNPLFLIDAMRVIKASEFELYLGAQDRPGMIKCDNFLYIVMPVNI